MESRWSDADAMRAVAHYADKGVSEDLALRTYTARLLGGDWRLVLHGGGNTSVKTTMRDVYGDNVRTLCVKGSGWDLATIEPAGHPAVRLDPLLRLRALDKLSDEDMVNVQRANLLDSAAPIPRSKPCFTPLFRTSSSITPIPSPPYRSPIKTTSRRDADASMANASRACPTSFRALVLPRPPPPPSTPTRTPKG